MATIPRGAVPTVSSDRPSAAEAAFDTAPLEGAVGVVAANATAWADTPPGVRAGLLDQVLADTLAASSAWLDDACTAKGIESGSVAAGEELFAGVGTFVLLARLLRDSLRSIEAYGRPRYPGPVRTGPGDRVAVGVFPASIYDRILFAGTSAEVVMQPGVTLAEVDAGQAAAYHDPRAAQGLALVLGAGNVGSLGPRDVLDKMFVEGKVVVLKANPVNDYLVPHWERAFASLIDGGFLRIVRGGPEAGAFLTGHPLVDEVHITGSDKTHDAIVFGTGTDGASRKEAGAPLFDKPITSELGNVSPVIIVPGEWSAADLRYQAEHVATMLVNNAGFNCITPRVLVTHRDWPQREAFLGVLTDVLAEIPTRRAYYPGASQRWEAFVREHTDAVEVGAADQGRLPWTLIRDLDPASTGDVCFNVEAFCGLFAETALPAASSPAFVDAAVEFCNDVLWGTLGATVLAHPRSLHEPAVARAVERAVFDLRYGAVGVNLWHAMAFALSATTWGAYPGHPLGDIGSGRGVVGNAYMFDRPEKSVIRGPFRARPKPAWFASHRGSYDVMRRLLAFEAAPSLRQLPGMMTAALRA